MIKKEKIALQIIQLLAIKGRRITKGKNETFLNDIVNETKIDKNYSYNKKETVKLFRYVTNYSDNFFGLVMEDEQCVQFSWEGNEEEWLLDIPLRSTLKNKEGHTSLQKYCNEKEAVTIIKSCFDKGSINFLCKVNILNESLDKIKDENEYKIDLSGFEVIIEPQNYRAIEKKIWKEFVPSSGQAKTVQGELLRAVEKLRYESLNNGNLNWDRGFNILVKYLSLKLLDENIFTKSELNEIKMAIGHLKNYKYPCLSEYFFDMLSHRVVDFYLFYGSMEHIYNDKLKR